MTTYYTHTSHRGVYYYRTQPQTAQLQIRYDHSDVWETSLRYTDSSNHMKSLVEIPMTEVPYLHLALLVQGLE